MTAMFLTILDVAARRFNFAPAPPGVDLGDPLQSGLLVVLLEDI